MSVATKKAENEKEKNPDGSVGHSGNLWLTSTEQAVHLLQALLEQVISKIHTRMLSMICYKC